METLEHCKDISCLGYHHEFSQFLCQYGWLIGEKNENNQDIEARDCSCVWACKSICVSMTNGWVIEYKVQGYSQSGNIWVVSAGGMIAMSSNPSLPSSTSTTNLPSLSRSLPLLAMEIPHTRRPSVQGMVSHPITTVLFPGRYWCDGCPGSDLCEGENNKKAEANTKKGYEEYC